jgi:hypothetical protein
MTFPTVAAFALLLEPESAIAYAPVAATITVAPVAMDVVSLCLLNILALGIMVVRPSHSVVDR